MWKIKLTLRSGVVIYLGDVRSHQPGWANCDPAGIVKLEFSFLGRDEKGQDIPYTLVMSGMKEYNFFVEAMQAVGSNRGMKIKGLWFLGKTPDEKITGFVLKESVMALNSEVGKEYHGMPTVGWKQGIIGDKVISLVNRGL